jgi:hypothetical protein
MIQNRGYLVELKYSPTRKGKSATKWGETAVDLSDKSKSKMKTKIKNIFFEKKCEEQN